MVGPSVRDRIERLLDSIAPPLLFLGVAGLFLTPRLIDGYVNRQIATWNAEHSPERGNLNSLVESNSGSKIGWFRITYSRKLRENEDAPLTVQYDASAWKSLSVANTAVFPSQISVSLNAVHLDIAPRPLEYVFDIDRLKLFGQDDHVWTISPKKEGDYTLIVHLQAQPLDSFSIKNTEVNSKLISNNNTNEFPLPLTVYTKFNVPQADIDVLKGVGTVFSFILTLPAAKMLLQSYLQRNRRRRG